MTHGKKYRQVKNLVDTRKVYTLDEALDLLPQTSTTKFDPSVEVGIKTFADPKYNDQQLRATVVLPSGTGKKVRIAVFTTEDKVDAVKKMGADVAGGKDLLEAIEAGKIDFDVILTETALMRDMAKVAKILGPKGLMPSPKAGTVTNDLATTIDEVKKGRVEFKLDKAGNVHAGLGKLSFGKEKIKLNIVAFVKAVNDNKPVGVKAKLIKKITLATTMGPGITITL